MKSLPCFMGILLVLLAGCGRQEETPLSETRNPHAVRPPAEQVAEMTGQSTEEVRETGKARPPGKTAAPPEEAGTAAPGAGREVYDRVCSSCHDQGIAGAPKTGDKKVWKPRIAKGLEVLVENAVNGFQGNRGIMPPKGGDPSLSEEEVRAAVRYMVEQSR